MHRARPLAVVAASALLLGAAVALPATAAQAAKPDRSVLQGSLETVAAGGQPGGWDGWRVEARVTGIPAAVATDTADADGDFDLRVTVPIPADGFLSITARPPLGGPLASAATLVSALVEIPKHRQVVVNERTTVAAAWSMAQFVSDAGVDGPAPGLRNSAGMAANLADPRTGEIGDVLGSSPNGDETSTVAAFGSISAALAACVTGLTGACAELIDIAGEAQDPAVPADAFRALAEIARNPGVADPLRLYELSTRVTLADGDVLPHAPAAWTLAVRFDGDGKSLSGPGNLAIDHEGNIWINNNYHYRPLTHTCGSNEIFRFSPTGDFSWFKGGGLSGSGFGIELDTATGLLWVSNYGFAAPGCPTPIQPPHDSVSLFSTLDETMVTGKDGWDAGELNWPQGIEVAHNRDVWFANCNDGTATVYRDGDPRQAENIDLGAHEDFEVVEPFDVVDNGHGLFVSGMISDSVQMLDYDGVPTATSPGSDPAVFENPMGLVVDDDDNVWVANSTQVDLPCPTMKSDPNDDDRGLGDLVDTQFDDTGHYVSGADPYIGSVALISPDGSTTTRYGGAGAGGATLPWGITTDGDGNVWVANFAGKRLSAFCGADPSTCPPGLSQGDAISPDLTGFFFDGLVRNTGVKVDQSGNVWVANNWLEIPYQNAPGGHEIVAFLGLAAPVQIAPPG